MRIRLFISLLLLVIAIGCSDDPNSVGNALIPENDKLKILTIDSETDSFEQEFVSFRKDSLFFGNSKRLLLGEYRNVSSDVLLRFFIILPDSIKTLLESTDSVSLRSSWIELYPDYWLGDKSSVDFLVNEIQTSWNPVEFNEDSLSLVQNSLGSNILESIDYPEVDTLIRFRIDSNVVNNWVYKTFDDSYPANEGLFLSPNSNIGIFGFQGITSFPRKSYPTLFLEFEKLNGFVDTVLAQPNLDIHIPSGEKLDDPVNEVILQGSIAIRGKLKFSLETVPEQILVNGATLELFVNNNNSFEADVTSDTIAVSMLKNFANDSIIIDYGRYPLSKDGEKYIGDIRQFVQRWIDGEPNEGVELKLNDESRSASAISIFGSSHPNSSLRPRLTISYTKK